MKLLQLFLSLKNFQFKAKCLPPWWKIWCSTWEFHHVSKILLRKKKVIWAPEKSNALFVFTEKSPRCSKENTDSCISPTVMLRNARSASFLLNFVQVWKMPGKNHFYNVNANQETDQTRRNHFKRLTSSFRKEKTF